MSSRRKERNKRIKLIFKRLPREISPFLLAKKGCLNWAPEVGAPFFLTLIRGQCELSLSIGSRLWIPVSLNSLILLRLAREMAADDRAGAG
jgi:hypothetical protein